MSLLTKIKHKLLRRRFNKSLGHALARLELVRAVAIEINKAARADRDVAAPDDKVFESAVRQLSVCSDLFSGSHIYIVAATWTDTSMWLRFGSSKMVSGPLTMLNVLLFVNESPAMFKRLTLWGIELSWHKNDLGAPADPSGLQAELLIEPSWYKSDLRAPADPSGLRAELLAICG